LPEFQALMPDDIVQVNLDIASAVSTVFGLLPKLRAHRDDITDTLIGFNLEQFDRLEDYAMALSHSNTQHFIATQPPDELQEVRDEGVEVRKRLLADVNTLIGRGYLNAASIKDLKGPVGYKNIATDLQILAAVLKDNWSTIQGKCAVQPSELNRVLKLAARILRVVGLREQRPATIAAAADIRMRAFTQFIRAYDNARRAIIYLRWHECDADEIAPSLYAGRSNSRKKTVDAAKKDAMPAPATGDAITNLPTVTATNATDESCPAGKQGD
jgi:hypothetical protein